ncbi:MAG: protein kinase [Gemmatimonadales bacterium]
MTAPSRLTAALADRYRIERELGQGGMATVYLAADLKHDRQVAIKVLRPELAAVIGADRFLSEIKTTANLQHPHILPLFDSGVADSFLFYVMPYVQGETMRDRIDREKQLPIADAVRIASEVASALDYAHRHGVIHRDIKPENILLHDGSALVADFGIALAASKAGGTRMTETGMSLGTPHYMSPEQAMGERDITARSDVYALGCVLYEMLLGEPPFTGPTAQSIVAKVMTEKPAGLTARRERVPPEVEDTVLTALEKLPADRFASAAEFAAGLVNPVRVSRTTPADRGRAGRGRLSGPAAPLAVLAAIAVIAATWGWLRPVPAPGPPSRLALLAPGLGGSGGSSIQRWLALSPDGGTVFYVGLDADGANQLMRQPLSALEPTPLDGTTNYGSPLVSPDGRWLYAAVNAGSTFRLPVGGGTPSPLPDRVMGTGGAAWGPDGTLWFSPGVGLGRGLLALTPGDSVIQFAADQDNSLQMLQVLPGGRHALVGRKLASAAGPLLLLDLRDGSTSPLIEQQMVEARYTAGYLLWVQLDGTLLAAPFDPDRPAPVGPGIRLAPGVSVTGTGLAQFAVAPNGTVAYVPEEPRSLQFVDLSGAAHSAAAELHNYHAPEFSPDGRRLSVDFNTADGRDVWILSLESGTLSRTTFDRDGHDATWVPDGRFITYSSVRSGNLGVYRKRPGSAEAAESLFASINLTYTGRWLPDGSALVTAGNDLSGDSRADIAILDSAGRGPLRAVVASPFNEQFPSVSPDGRWLAFASDQSGDNQVYVRPLTGDGDQVQISVTGGTEPLWSPGGQTLYYRGRENGVDVMTAATIRTAPEVAVLDRRSLFSMADYVGTTPHTNYALSPDGQTFALVRRNPATRIVIIQHLPALMQQLQGAAGAPR